MSVESPRIRVATVDDHPYFREGVRAVLQTDPKLELVGEAADGPAALELIARVPLDVLLLDIGMPGQNGIRVAREVVARAPGVRVIMLSAYDKPQYVLAAQRAGASAYVVKTNGNLLATVHAVAAGLKVLPEGVALGPAPWDVLTDMQLKVAVLVATNHSDKQTASKLGITHRTVEKHRQDIRERLRSLRPSLSADPLVLARWLIDWGELDENAAFARD
jgi:NarL family two-component system response regulator LiaR